MSGAIGPTTGDERGISNNEDKGIRKHLNNEGNDSGNSGRLAEMTEGKRGKIDSTLQPKRDNHHFSAFSITYEN